MGDHENTENIKTEDGAYRLGTWGFLKAGWWVWHIIAILGVFYLGWIYGNAIFS